MKPTSHQLAITLYGPPRIAVFEYPGAGDEVASIARRLIGRIIPSEATTLGVMLIDEHPGDGGSRIAPLVTYGKEPGALILASLFEDVGHVLGDSVCAGDGDVESIVCSMASLLGMGHSTCRPSVFFDPSVLAAFAAFALDYPERVTSAPSISLWRRELAPRASW